MQHFKSSKLTTKHFLRLGKTSLAEAIVSCQAADAGVNIKTIGIDFFHWKEQLPDTDEMLDVMIVDCAGEKKYLLTHQLFLSVGNIHFYFALAKMHCVWAHQNCSLCVS